MSAESPPASSLDQEHSSPRPWLLLIAVLAVVAGCYMPVLGAPFIWDDTHLVESPLVRQLAPLHDYFASSFWQHDEAGVVHSYYRPLAILSLALDHRVYGDNPGGFHVTNLLFHLAATSALFRLLRQGGAGGYGAALGSALWALEPRLTEAAAWISGRTDVLAGFFVLCALLAQRSASKLAPSIVALFLLLGLFSKETAFAGVLAVCVAEWQRGPGTRAARLAPTLVMFASYVTLRLEAVGMPTNLMQVSPVQRVLAVAEAVGRYLWMLLIPWLPDAQIGNLNRRNVPFTVLGGLLFCALIVGFLRARRQLGPPQGSYFVLTASALGLALYAIPFSVSAVAADRFLYLPLAGLTLLALPVLSRAARRWRALPFVALAGAASFAAGTFLRASTWADDVEFWTTTLRRHPEEPSMASIGLASAFLAEGLFGQALAVLHRATQPGMDVSEMAMRNTGTTLLRSGRYQEAENVFGALVAQHPESPVYAINLALAEVSLNHFDSARQVLDRALAVTPDVSARDLRARLAPLEAQRRQLDAWAPPEPLLTRARLEVTLGLKVEAVSSFAQILDEPGVTVAEAEEATRFALLSGDTASRDRFFKRYSELARGRTDPELQLAYEAHQETQAKLEAVWPTLGLEE